MLLSLVKSDNQGTALLRLESSLQRDGTIPNIIGTHCSALGAMRASREETYVVEKLMAATSRNSTMPRCSLLIESTQHQRFHLQGEWLFALRVISDRDGLLVQRKIAVQVPEPLCLLPFIIILLGMLAQIWLPRFAWLAIFYLFLLGGFNFLEILQSLASSFPTTDQHGVLAAGIFADRSLARLVKESNRNTGHRAEKNPYFFSPAVIPLMRDLEPRRFYRVWSPPIPSQSHADASETVFRFSNRGGSPKPISILVRFR